MISLWVAWYNFCVWPNMAFAITGITPAMSAGIAFSPWNLGKVFLRAGGLSAIGKVVMRGQCLPAVKAAWGLGLENPASPRRFVAGLPFDRGSTPCARGMSQPPANRREQALIFAPRLGLRAVVHFFVFARGVDNQKR